MVQAQTLNLDFRENSVEVDRKLETFIYALKRYQSRKRYKHLKRDSVISLPLYFDFGILVSYHKFFVESYYIQYRGGFRRCVRTEQNQRA